MKYVILEDHNGGKWPFLFPETLVHSEVAKGLENMMTSPSQVYSAGFWEGRAHGESESLGIKSKEGDTGYILFGESVKYMPPEMVINIMKIYMEKRHG